MGFAFFPISFSQVVDEVDPALAVVREQFHRIACVALCQYAETAVARRLSELVGGTYEAEPRP